MRKQKLFRNRRAEIPDFISDIFSFFLYLLFFLMFFILFSLSFGGCNKISSQSQEIQAEWNLKAADSQLLHNYLRTNLSFDGRQMTYAELIAESCIDDNYEAVKEKTAELMAGGVEKAALIRLSVKCDPESKNFIELYKFKPDPKCSYDLVCASSSDTASMEIPFPYKEGEVGYAALRLESCGYYENKMDANGVSYPEPIDPDDVSLRAGGCLR